MNILDIIVIAIFLISVLVCTIKGFLKIIAGFGAICVALIAARQFGGLLGGLLLEKYIGGFAPVVGTAVFFVILLIVCRIIFGLVAKMITKILHTKTIDKILGAIVGAVGGIAFAYPFCMVFGIVISVIDLVGVESQLPAVAGDSFIFKYLFN